MIVGQKNIFGSAVTLDRFQFIRVKGTESRFAHDHHLYLQKFREKLQISQKDVIIKEIDLLLRIVLIFSMRSIFDTRLLLSYIKCLRYY